MTANAAFQNLTVLQTARLNGFNWIMALMGHIFNFKKQHGITSCDS